jgi:glycerophosphoryl diester phosphodiesterase
LTSTKLLLGHRGACLANLPENTFATFDLSLDAGCDGFEFDVRRTRDGRLVVFHDPEVCGLAIAGATYDEILRRWQDRVLPRFSHSERAHEVKIPCLEGLLDRYSKRAFLDIEVKVAGIEEAVLSVLRKHALARGYVVSSFLPDVLKTLAELDPEIPLGLICDRRNQLAGWPALPVSHVIPHQKLVTPALIGDLHSAGKTVIAWTVNDEGDMRRLAGWDVDGLVSDDPGLLCRVVGAGKENEASQRRET